MNNPIISKVPAPTIDPTIYTELDYNAKNKKLVSSDITFDFIENAYKKFNFSFFKSDIKDFNLNIWGIRSSDLETDAFNDFIGISWQYGIKKFHYVFSGTTDPGLYYLKNPINVKGTAIMVHNKQYRGVYELGIHKKGTPTAHDALVQRKPMLYWRDTNRDNYRDVEKGKIHNEIAKTNVHSKPANFVITQNIGKWSAGCQVVADPTKFHNIFIPIIRSSVAVWGNCFSYSLFFERDL